MPAISSNSWIDSSIGISASPVPSSAAARWSKVPRVLLAHAKTLASATTVRITDEISADSTSTPYTSFHDRLR